MGDGVIVGRTTGVTVSVACITAGAACCVCVCAADAVLAMIISKGIIVGIAAAGCRPGMIHAIEIKRTTVIMRARAVDCRNIWLPLAIQVRERIQ